MSHVDLSLVHVVQNDFDLLDFDVLEKDDGVFAGVLHEEALEIRRTGWEDHLVALDWSVLAGQGDVAKSLSLWEVMYGHYRNFLPFNILQFKVYIWTEQIQVSLFDVMKPPRVIKLPFRQTTDFGEKI